MCRTCINKYILNFRNGNLYSQKYIKLLKVMKIFHTIIYNSDHELTGTVFLTLFPCMEFTQSHISHRFAVKPTYLQ